ncbi:hypothetical protein BH24DEI2_BH24DEI2_21740 [soil metagenome]
MTLPIALAATGLLIAGFLLDLATAETLVVAIVYNIPIALSGLAMSRRLTLATILAALAADGLAGYFNMRSVGFQEVVVLNRTIAGLSFLLVGFLTLALHDAAARVTTLKLEETRARREHALREIAADLSGPLHPEALLERATHSLRALLKADSVVVATFEAEPALPPNEALGEVIAATVDRDPPVLTVHLGGLMLTVGLWRRLNEPVLVVVAHQPQASEPALLLSEALRGLEPLLERAKLLADVERQRGALAERNAVIRDLVYAFSHDLRTPLMANAMTMQLALDGAFGELGAEFRSTLKNGLSANEDLLELAESLLLVARFESGEPLSHFEPINLSKLLKLTLARLAPIWGERRIIAEVAEDFVVPGRAAELGRVLQNLLDNAVKFSAPDSLITVTLCRLREEMGEGVRLEVLDEGVGIAAEQQKRLFKRFSSGRAGGGKGLGLYLARQIIEAHGGRIHFSPREGGGSRFSFWLPLAEEAVA